jgi:hypothetical protein
MSDAHDEAWQALATSIEALRTDLARSKATKVAKESLRQQAREIVQQYFRRVRPHLLDLDCDPSRLDSEMQALLRLANGVNRRTTYVQTLGRIRKRRSEMEVDREMRLGSVLALDGGADRLDRTEELILTTLQRLAPSAALSYEQAMLDLNDPNRVSYRGTANELREGLREVLDQLAPDDQVSASSGFKLENGQTKPTQRQKVRYILKSRDLGESARKTPEDAVSLIDELTASLTRAAYARSSVSAHVATAQQEVRQLKMYIDSVLAELLAIHGTS